MARAAKATMAGTKQEFHVRVREVETTITGAYTVRLGPGMSKLVCGENLRASEEVETIAPDDDPRWCRVCREGLAEQRKLAAMRGSTRVRIVLMKVYR